MGYFGDYQRQAIQPGYVDQEGDYELTIIDIKTGELTDKDTNKPQRYTQVVCRINYKTNPQVSIFLTEGKNFDGNFTAFCDTFGIDPAGRDFAAWLNKRGFVHILLKKKDGFTNMVPRWILGDDGFVLPDVKRAANGGLAQQPLAPAAPYTPAVNTFAAAMGGTVVDGPDGDKYGDIPF